MITTPRLRLRRPELSDFDDYEAMWSHPDILVHMSSGSFTAEQMWTRFLRQAGGWHYLGFGYFSIEERETKRFVGQTGFQDLRREISPSLEGSMEAGWTIHPQAQGLGYAGEAARGLFDWGAENFSGKRATCIIAPENGPSLRIAAKMGMTEFARSTYQDKPVVMFERVL